MVVVPENVAYPLGYDRRLLFAQVHTEVLRRARARHLPAGPLAGTDSVEPFMHMMNMNMTTHTHTHTTYTMTHEHDMNR